MTQTTHHQTSTHEHAVRMSNRQYGLLRYLRDAKRPIKVAEVSHLNQLTVGGNKRRGWLNETSSHDGIVLTDEGKDALKAFEHGDFMRQVARMKFSSFLTLDVYDSERKRKPQQIARTLRRVA